MTQIGTFSDASVSSGTVYLFGLIAPATGNTTFVANWTGSNQVIVFGISLVSVDQTGGSTTFRNVATNNGTGTPSSVTVSSVVGDIVVAGHVMKDISASGPVSGTDIGHNDAGNIDSGAANYDVGGASVSLTYGFSGGTGQWAAMGVSVKCH